MNLWGFGKEVSKGFHVSPPAVPLFDGTATIRRTLLGAEAGQCLTLSNTGSMFPHCRHSRPVTVRRQSGAPLAPQSTLPEGGHTTDTERQPCRANAPLSGARAAEASTP